MGSDSIIVLAIIIHTLQAVVFLCTASANGAVGPHAFIVCFGGRHGAAAALILAGIAAAVGQWVEGISPSARFLLLMGQQALFIITAVSAISLVLAQHYADYVYRSWEFILCDQSPLIAMPFLHAVAMYARVRTRA